MQDDPAKANATSLNDTRPPRPPFAEGDDRSDADPGLGSEATVQDWIEAERSRPTLPDETADGLDPTDEELRHQAEDLPLDTFLGEPNDHR